MIQIKLNMTETSDHTVQKNSSFFRFCFFLCLYEVFGHGPSDKQFMEKIKMFSFPVLANVGFYLFFFLDLTLLLLGDVSAISTTVALLSQ